MPSAFRLDKPQREQGRADQDEGKIPVSTRHKVGSKFTAIHWPHAWDYDPEYGFLPSIRDILAKPGANGQKIDKKTGMTQMSPAISKAVEGGAVRIDSTDSRLGEFKDYLVYYPCTDGRRWYCWAAAEPTVLPNGRVIWNDEEIETWLKRMAVKLRDEGIVPALLPEVFEDMRQKKQRRLDGMASRAGNNPHLQAKYEEAKAVYDQMVADWQALLEAEEKAAKASGTGRKVRAKKAKAAEVSDG